MKRRHIGRVVQVEGFRPRVDRKPCSPFDGACTLRSAHSACAAAAAVDVYRLLPTSIVLVGQPWQLQHVVVVVAGQ